MIRSIALLLLLICSITVIAQQQNDLKNSVQVNASYSKSDQTITLNWENYQQAIEYQIYQRNIGSASWGTAIATVVNDTFYTFTNVDIGNLKEYRVRRISNDGNAEGYTYSAIEYQPLRFGFKSIVLVESEIRDSLAPEIDRYISDLHSEGWITSEIIVNKDDTALAVKNAILAVFNTDQFRYKMITIIGHVPVPYSGNIGPDGHSNHIGAWPCDGYYADTNGSWTDNSVSNTTASQSRNHNIPGDGKFDQSIFPSELEMSIGRIDFANLPLFEESEVELTKRYLDKNHAYRTGALKSIKRGLVENNFSLAEGFGQNGYRNISALVGRDSTYSRDYDVLKSDPYLWSYGAGGGNFQGANGISNTTNFTQDSIQSIFTMLFGSYFGDFDSNNNFLRSALATGTVLSNVWAGRPNWHFHPMGMGFSLGDCTKLSMNNTSYVTGFGARQVHMALMGDPSLKMSYVESPSGITTMQLGNNIQIDWEASNELDITGYHIYRKTNNNTPELLDTLITEKSYIDRCAEIGNYTYYVTAVRLEEGITGSFFNESQHIEATIEISEVNTPIAEFTFTESNLEVSFESSALNAQNHYWVFGDGNTSTEVNPIHTYEDIGNYDIQLIVNDPDLCYSDTLTVSIELMPSTVFENHIDNKIFPNPTRDILNLKSSKVIQQVSIIDISGSKIYDQYFNRNDIILDIALFPKGMYYLSIMLDNDKTYKSKFVKQ